MVSDDSDFERKAADIIGLCLDPPQHAASSVCENSAIRALDRLDPVLARSPVGSNVTGLNAIATAPSPLRHARCRHGQGPAAWEAGYFVGGGNFAKALLIPFEIFTLASFTLSPTSAMTEPRQISRFLLVSAISMLSVPFRAA